MQVFDRKQLKEGNIRKQAWAELGQAKTQAQTD